jgi:thiamine biosynthesis lipoprotein ApbE
MHHTQRVFCLCLLLSIYINPTAASRDASDFVFYHENVMGTSLELRLSADSERAARAAEDRVLAEIDRLSAIFSGYDAKSEFSRWQSAPKGPVKVSRELFELLEACDAWRERSHGAFDPCVEALSRLWAHCQREKRLPTIHERKDALALMAAPAWRLDNGNQTAERLSACPISLNAIAKGYIVGKACDVGLDTAGGIRGVLLNVGGDMCVRGKPARVVGIASPFVDSESSEPIEQICVRDRAVATSGSSQRGFRINGQWFSHILDPSTGHPVSGIAGATVIAKKSADADALATILNVLDPKDGLHLVSSMPGVECQIISSDGKVTRSAGWNRFRNDTPRGELLASAAARQRAGAAQSDAAKADAETAARSKPAGWGADFELAVNLEINNPDTSRRYRRPYVVVWIEDKKDVPVRTLSLWVSSAGAGPEKWLPDLKRWYRGEEIRRLNDTIDVVHTISRPTRSPGKYTVIWDGTDNHGKPLERGEYTIFIEAAREHGTYQSIRKPITIGEKPFAEELKGNVEIKSASLEYRRKAPPK